MDPEADTKKCPYCAETIKAEAVVCRHCGRDLVTGQLPDQSQVVQEEPKKKGANPLLILILLTAVLGGIYILYSAVAPVFRGQADPANPQPPQSTSRTVVYKIDGASAQDVSLTYQAADGSTQQEKAPVGWTKELEMSQGDFAYLSGQLNTDRGRVSCSITVDGKPFKQAESRGPYVIASCNGAVP